jgi:site-specific DNA-methyltransferase (adenine-specific)
VLTASQPFTSALVMSNIKWFKYEWIYKKTSGSNFATTKYQPMKEHENILVFGNGVLKYNPVLQERSVSGKERISYGYKSETKGGEVYNNFSSQRVGKEYNQDLRQPSSVQLFNNRDNERGLHPTQKPIALFEYLIKTYTNEGDLVLDNCAGSGTTGVACRNLKRNYILIEKEEKYIKVIKNRLRQDILC